tara:strand:- start:21348 stop:22136 length:789 start_codon:yes stop_codon:yes gene_type:complete
MITFEKWHGNGNDFMIINSLESNLKIRKSFIKKNSNRNKGIGFDQLIHIDLPSKSKHNFKIEFYNADGSKAKMCINGVRCAASYIWRNSLAPKIPIKLGIGLYTIICSPNKKNYNISSTLVDRPKNLEIKKLVKDIDANIKDNYFLSNIGNNHLCIEKESINCFELEQLYNKLKKKLLKHEINLSIYEKDGNFLRIRTYENGSGETLSCGSASLCVAAKELNTEKKSIVIESLGGKLKFQLDNNAIFIKGTANFIFEGSVDE